MQNTIKMVAAGAAMMLMTMGAGYAAQVSTAHLGGCLKPACFRCNGAGIASACGISASTKMSSAGKAKASASAIARNAANAPIIASVCGGLASTKRSEARKAKATAAVITRSAADANGLTEAGAIGGARSFY